MAIRPFQTPANQRSFSALVDQVVSETGRPNNLLTIISKANMTIRECQSLGLFARDRIEDAITTDAVPFTWTRPGPTFRSIGAAKYVCACVYPELLVPGKKQQNRDYYFYAADDYYVFNGALFGETIALAYYNWANPLMYFGALGVDTAAFPGGPYLVRPAYFDIALMAWQYYVQANSDYEATTGTDAGDLLARTQSSMWLIDDWYDMIVEGTKAKIFALYSDERAPVAYSSYKQSQTIIANTVGFEGEAATIGIG